ncbi:MAG: hypothetical protein Q9193_004715 [Seirophora villosa]
MKSYPLPLLFFFSSLLIGLFSFATAKPVTWSGSSTHRSNTVATRDLVPPDRLSKRAHSTPLPGGWICNFAAELQAFDHISSASASLEDFYSWALNELNSGRHDRLLTDRLSIEHGPFELVFRHRDAASAVSLTMVRAFLALMLQRSQRGWAVKYAGWVEGPGGIAVDMLLNIVAPVVTSSILDSAMDMYGY